MDEQAKWQLSTKVGMFCENRVPLHAQNQIKMFYRIKGDSVIIFESRPDWKDNSVWNDLPIAKIKFLPDDKTWQLFWQRANGNWLEYPDFTPTTDLDEVISEIDTDPNHVFWG